MQESLFNKVSRLQAKERFLHRCFPVSFTKYFRAFFLQNTSAWLLLLNSPFLLVALTSARKKTFPSTLVISNIFETKTVNCLRTALCGGPRQTVSCDLICWFIAKRASDMSKMLLEIGSSHPAVFCKNEIL